MFYFQKHVNQLLQPWSIWTGPSIEVGRFLKRHLNAFTPSKYLIDLQSLVRLSQEALEPHVQFKGQYYYSLINNLIWGPKLPKTHLPRINVTPTLGQNVCIREDSGRDAKQEDATSADWAGSGGWKLNFNTWLETSAMDHVRGSAQTPFFALVSRQGGELGEMLLASGWNGTARGLLCSMSGECETGSQFGKPLQQQRFHPERTFHRINANKEQLKFKEQTLDVRISRLNARKKFCRFITLKMAHGNI